MTKRVMFYVQHLLGIGHLARASLICGGLVKEGFEVKMAMGGSPVDGFPGLGIDVEYLPVLKAGCFKFNDLTDADGTLVDQNYLDQRRTQLLQLFSTFKPDILIIEAFPFGRRQMRFELLPLLDAAKAAPWKPLIAGSVRDIVQEKKKPKRLQETVDTIKKYYDLVLVHGDPNFIKLDATFPLANEIEHLIKYTGIVSADIPPLSGPSYDVIVSAGGGGAGELIMLTAIQARVMTKLADANWCFITGPNFSKTAREKLGQNQPENVTIETHRTDFRALLANAQLSVSQAGYNTTADILRAGCASVLVPFSSGGETEQTRRADLMAAHDAIQSISEEGLTAKSLADAIDKSLQFSEANPSNPVIATDGAEKTAAIFQQALDLQH